MYNNIRFFAMPAWYIKIFLDKVVGLDYRASGRNSGKIAG
jgi:hypothetical protein